MGGGGHGDRHRLYSLYLVHAQPSSVISWTDERGRRQTQIVFSVPTYTPSLHLSSAGQMGGGGSETDTQIVFSVPSTRPASICHQLDRWEGRQTQIVFSVPSTRPASICHQLDRWGGGGGRQTQIVFSVLYLVHAQPQSVISWTDGGGGAEYSLTYSGKDGCRIG